MADHQADGDTIWDEQAALKALMGKEDLLQRLVNLYFEQIDLHLNGIEVALAADNVDQCILVTHTLKGSAGQLKAAQLQDVAAEMERSAKGGDIDRFRELNTDLQAAHEALAARFNDYLAGKTG